MVHLPASLLLLLSISTAFALPTAQHRAGRRDINISHISKVNGTAVTHTIDSATLDPALKAAIEGSDLNINLIGDRRRAVEKRAAGITNSTINLTVISKRDQSVRKTNADRPKRRQVVRTRSNSTVTPPPTSPATNTTAEAPTHHNILIDASTSGNGLGGGISNSTININLNSRALTRRKVNLGDHSILVDTEHVEDSTVHVNILPVRALDKSVGKHSILIDSSSGNESGTTSAGDHSGVVDTSSSSSSNSSSTGIKSSTINMTVVSPKEKVAEAEAGPAPLVRRSESSTAWSAAIKHRSFDTNTTEESTDPLPAPIIAEVVEDAEELLRAEVRRRHASRPSRFDKKQ